MSERTEQQMIPTHDGTEITFNSWRRDGDSCVMSPGASRFSAICPQHGEIDSSYEALTVMFAVRDHAKAEHGGVHAKDLMDSVPAIQL